MASRCKLLRSTSRPPKTKWRPINRRCDLIGSCARHYSGRLRLSNDAKKKPKDAEKVGVLADRRTVRLTAIVAHRVALKLLIATCDFSLSGDFLSLFLVSFAINIGSCHGGNQEKRGACNLFHEQAQRCCCSFLSCLSNQNRLWSISSVRYG